MPDPTDETKPEDPNESPIPKVEIPKASPRSSARKSAPRSAKSSSKKAKKSGKKSAKKPGKVKAKRKASPKAHKKSLKSGSKLTSNKRSATQRSSVSARSSSKKPVGKKGRGGIRLDGKPRLARGDGPSLSPADLKYGAKIALARRLKPMSQGEVVKKLGLTQGYYSAIERGAAHANEATRAKIKKVVGV
jgi:ribosome-binding protein aMBF1 (putative translation factor)